MHSVSVTQTATSATSALTDLTIERGRSLFASFANLLWLPECGIGWYPVTEQPYDDDYWQKYRRYDATPTGELLTTCRLDLVHRFNVGSVIDIGIGGGKFVESCPGALGFDINPAAIDWLKSGGKWADPYATIFEAATFWDSLEHIHNPRPILRNVRRYCFVSLPIFKDCNHILRSKHFRKDEHCWYFTRRGINLFMRSFGFKQLERSTMEQACGREDIETYVFERTGRQ